jgi:Diaminopimelate decarboxylase
MGGEDSRLITRLPSRQPIRYFQSYFETYNCHLKLHPQHTLQFELGRAVVGQWGSLISHVLYVKQGTYQHVAILDAGMTDLIRTDVCHAFHQDREDHFGCSGSRL